jgi:hypothetical protein
MRIRDLSRIAFRRSLPHRKVRNRRFFPESPERDCAARLEGRFLTAPSLRRSLTGGAIVTDGDLLSSNGASNANAQATISQVATAASGSTAPEGAAAAGTAIGAGAQDGASGIGILAAGPGIGAPYMTGYTAAFYRNPEGSPKEEASDFVTSAWTTNGTIVTSNATSPAESSSSAYISATNPAGTVSVIGNTTSTIADLADPVYPNAPVGDASTSFITNSQINYTGPPSMTGDSVTSSGSRGYTIAVIPGTPTTGWSVTENYQISYAAPTAMQDNPMFVTMAAGLNTPTLAIAVAGANTITSFKINGVAVGGSGTMSAPDGGTIHYTWGPLGADVSATTPLATVGVASTNPVTGPAWPVTDSAGIGLVGGAPGVAPVSLESKLTTNYGASVST